MNYNEFLKVVFEELRTLVIDYYCPLTDDNIIKAITFNENLKEYGYTLKPEGIIKIAKSDMLDELMDIVKGFFPDIKIDPMYPNFPTQVMEMDAATFRFHQTCHYFSTYGIELLTGEEVTQGWLPTVENTEKIKEDKGLLPLKVVDVKNLMEISRFVALHLISKKERFTIPEIKIAEYAVINLSRFVDTMHFGFKENMLQVLHVFFNDCYSIGCLDDFVDIARMICDHAGDVLDFVQYEMEQMNYKTQNNYYLRSHGHFKQSQKRVLVRLLESYGRYNLMDNLVMKRNRNLTILRYLSYNKFAKDADCMDVVHRFRDKRIRNWYSHVDKELELYKKKELSAKEVIDFIGKRPGELLRMLVRLYKIDFQLLIEASNSLQDNIDKVSMQTLISIARYFNQDIQTLLEESDSATRLYEITAIRTAIDILINAKMKLMDTPLKDKKVYLEEGIYDFDHSSIEINDKLEEGGYIRSGLAFKIPDDVKVLRFFVYWNDKNRVDVDLHSEGTDIDGNYIHIGWNGHFNSHGIVTSGDITHSNAAEYIDIDLDKANKVNRITNEIVIYYGKPNFKTIDTVFTGMMAVSEAGLKNDVKLYSTKNVFFRHDLESKNGFLKYAFIDVQDRYLKLLGSKINDTEFSLRKYLDMLFIQQNVITVDNKEEADIILALDKQLDENSISLIDENYFIV